MRERPKWRLSIAGKTAAALLALAVSTAAQAQRVLVFPLEQEKGVPATEWIGTGLAVAMDEALALGRVTSVPYEELRRFYEQEGLVDHPRYSLSAQVPLARELGAGVFARGSYKVHEGKITVHLQALDISSDLRGLGSWTESGALRDLLALTRRLAANLCGALGKAGVTGHAIKPEAFESYIRGRISDEPTVQEVYFRRALEIEPAYDNASCHLARALRDKGQVAESKALLETLEKREYAKSYLGLLLLAEYRTSEGRYAEARRLLLASLKTREGAEAHLGLARLYLKEGKPQEAERELVIVERFGTLEEEIDTLRQDIQGSKAQEAPAGGEGK